MTPSSSECAFGVMGLCRRTVCRDNLDEPTSALDSELVSEVLDVIRRLAVEDGLTMMISTRQISFAKEVADRTMFLADGSIVEEGSADDVLSRPKNARTAQFLQIMTHEAAAQA